MTIEDRLRAHLEREAAGVRPAPGDAGQVMRRGRRRRTVTRAATAVAAVAVVAVPVLAVQGGPGPAQLPSATQPSSPEPSAPSSSTTDSTSTTATTAPVVRADLPAMVTASPEGISRMEAGEVVESHPTGPVMTALDAGEGRFLVQIGSSASDILRFADGAFDPLVSPAAGEVLELHEVSIAEGSAQALYTVRQSGSGEELRTLDLGSGDTRAVGRPEDPEAEVTRASRGGDLSLASMEGAGGNTWFEVFGADGEPVELDANPRPAPDVDAGVSVRHGVLSPDAATMAYLQAPEGAGEAVSIAVVDLATGAEVASYVLDGVEAADVTRLDWDGTVAVVSFGDREAVALAGGDSTRLGVTGSVALSR